MSDTSQLVRELEAAPALGDMLRTYAKFGVCSCVPFAAFAGLIRLGVFDTDSMDRARELVAMLDEVEGSNWAGEVTP